MSTTACTTCGAIITDSMVSECVHCGATLPEALPETLPEAPVVGAPMLPPSPNAVPPNEQLPAIPMLLLGAVLALFFVLIAALVFLPDRTPQDAQVVPPTAGTSGPGTRLPTLARPTATPTALATVRATATPRHGGAASVPTVTPLPVPTATPQPTATVPAPTPTPTPGNAG